MSRIQRTNIKFIPLSLASLLVMSGLAVSFVVGNARAATFASAFVRLDRLQAATATGGRVCATPATTTAAAATVRVTFPTTNGTDYVVNATAANWTVTTTGLDTGQNAWPGIGTATSVSGKTVTFPSTGSLTAGTTYCFNFSGTNTLTTSSAGASETTQGTVAIWSSVPAVIASTTYSESIITSDQIVVNAVVPPSFNFVLSGNTDSFTTNLSLTSPVSTSGRTVTITTNAASGWIVWVKDLNNNGGKGALQSATASNYDLTGSTAPGAASHTISTSGGHPEDYGLGTTINTDAAGGGTVSLNAAYDGTGSKIGTLDPTQFRPIASSNGTAAGDIISLTESAIATASTPAANDYTDTLTVVGAGQF